MARAQPGCKTQINMAQDMSQDGEQGTAHYQEEKEHQEFPKDEKQT